MYKIKSNYFFNQRGALEQNIRQLMSYQCSGRSGHSCFNLASGIFSKQIQSFSFAKL